MPLFLTENDCSVVALATISGVPYRDVRAILARYGYDPAKGSQPAPITLAAEEVGFTWSVKGSKAAAGKTPGQIAAEGWPGAWLLFCKDHVMPMVDGRVSNLCGYGEEPVRMVMELKKMKNKPFREAVRDLFGFDANTPKPAEPEKQDEYPIQHFDMKALMDDLNRLKVGALRVSRPFEDEVRWGETDGAIRARLTPNQGVSLERLSTDLTGRPFWVTKRLVKMKTNEYAGREDVVAGDIRKLVLDLSTEPIDAPVRAYKDLFAITRRVAEGVRNANDKFIYQEIKKVSETNYNILFSLANYGVGKIARRIKGGPTPAGIVDMSYDPERGAIKGILTTIEAEGESDSWEIGIPYFMGEFSPTQPVEEIVRAMQAGLKFI